MGGGVSTPFRKLVVRREVRNGVRLLCCSVGVLGFAPHSLAADWRLTPSLQVDETYNDNVNLSPKGTERSDFITSISPGLNLIGDGARLKLGVTYAPQQLIFASGTSADTLQQRLQGTGQAILLPEALFLDANASIDQQYLNNTGPVAATTLTGSSNLQTVEAVNASPYLRHHFGPYADTETRYRFGYVNTSGNTIAPIQINEALQKITGGEVFGRLNWTLTADWNKIDRLRGTNDPLSGISSTDELVKADLQYAVYQGLSVIGSFGYEHITDPTLTIKPSGVIWNAGLQYQPNPSALLALTYGRRFEESDIQFNGQYDITAQLRIRASYTQSVQTSQAQIAGNVNQLALGPNGTLINAATGLPFVAGNAPFGNSTSAFGITSGSFLDKRFQMTAEINRGRNNFVLAAYDEHQSGQAFAGNSHAVGGTASWGRQLWPDLSSTLAGGYSDTSFEDSSGRHDNFYYVTAALSYALSPTASLQFSFNRSDRESNQAQNTIIDNLIAISIRKQF